MNRRDRLVELSCLWHELHADRPPLRCSRGAVQRAALPPTYHTGAADAGARLGERPTRRTG